MGYTTLLLFIVPAVLGYKTGPPVAEYSSLCTDMIPIGHNNGDSLATDTATPPYTITTSADKYTAGGSLTVTVTAKTAGTIFEGFFIQARRADPARDKDVAVGTFAYPPPKTQLLECHTVNNSAWSHSDDPEWSTVTAVWNAPAQDEGPIEFKATIVSGEPSKDYFYLGVKSSQISFMAGAAITVQPPTQPSANDGPSTTPSSGSTHSILLTLVAVSLVLGVSLAIQR